MLAYEDAAAAIDWLSGAFGFSEREGARFTADDGTVTHAELDVGDGSLLYLSTPSPHYRGPRRHRETCADAARWLDNPWVIDGLMVQVEDLDAHHERARAAGADVLRGPEDAEAIGIRLYTAEDPEGHRWMFVQPLDR
ncbi:MAG: VOC family protein [Thermoleophilia bacterium]|nr:VOC family protein [Thermoleophilia bacterium]